MCNFACASMRASAVCARPPHKTRRVYWCTLRGKKSVCAGNGCVSVDHRVGDVRHHPYDVASEPCFRFHIAHLIPTHTYMRYTNQRTQQTLQTLTFIMGTIERHSGSEWLTFDRRLELHVGSSLLHTSHTKHELLLNYMFITRCMLWTTIGRMSSKKKKKNKKIIFSILNTQKNNKYLLKECQLSSRSDNVPYLI